MRAVIAAGAFLMLSLYSITGYSQEPAGPAFAGFIDDGIASPTAAGLGMYGSIPVNMSTGVPGISIPITTITAGNISLPVSLNYNASGIKVTEEPGPVGMSWSLNAGGVITRIVRGHPDELNQGTGIDSRRGYYATLESLAAYYTPKTQGGMDLGEQKDFLLEVARNRFDTEPDVYFYNFGGNSGMFVIDGKGGYVSFPDANLKIEYSTPTPITPESAANSYGYDSGIDEFVVTTDDGTRYTFNFSERSDRRIPDDQNGEGGFPLNSLTPFEGIYKSAWFLTEISHPQQQQLIVLKYDSLGLWIEEPEFPNPDSTYATAFTDYLGSSTIIYDEIEHANCNSTTASIKTSFSRQRVRYHARVQEIVIRNQTDPDKSVVNFNYSDDNNNLPMGFRLNSIQVKDHVSSEEIKSVHFNYGNFQGSEELLKLESVQENFPGAPTASLPPYEFTYNSGSLEPRHSPNRDYLGYQRENRLADHLIGGPKGKSRQPSLSHTKRGVLQKITYPTGGHTEFEYELNTAQISGNSQDIGGLRVKKITDWGGGDNPPVIKEYKYGTGSISSSLAQIFTHGFYRRVKNYEVEGTDCITVMGSSETTSPLLGHFVKYDHVTEIIDEGNGGLISETFQWYGSGNFDAIYRNSLPESRQLKNNKELVLKESTTDYKTHSGSFALGLPGQMESITWLRPNIQYTPKPFGQTDTTFAPPFGGAYKTIWAHPKTESVTEYTYTSVFVEGEDCPPSQNPDPDPECEVVEDSYEYEVSDALTTSTAYFYQNPFHKQPTSIVTTNSTGESIKQVLYYAHEAFQGMRAGNMLVQPYSVTWFDSENNILKGQTLLWDLFNGKWYPSELYQRVEDE